MITSRNDQFRLRQLRREQLKRFYHEFEAFVRAPFTECQDALRWGSTTGVVRELGSPGKQTVRPKVNIVPPVLIIQDLAISRHENRDGVGEQEHSGCHGSRKTVKPLVLHAGIFEFDRIHEVVQSHMRVPPA